MSVGLFAALLCAIDIFVMFLVFHFEFGDLFTNYNQFCDKLQSENNNHRETYQNGHSHAHEANDGR